MRISDWSSDVCSSDLLALRDAFDDVEQDDVAQFLDRRQMSERPADVACADERDLLASHKTSLSYQLPARRSEEHTSELQSLMRISYAVFCLKKKNKKQHKTPKSKNR